MNRDKFKIRCKCDKCEATTLVKITEYLGQECQPRCFRSGLGGRNFCDGRLHYFTDDFNDAASNAHNLLAFLATFDDNKPSLQQLLDHTVEDFGIWMEHEQTPQEMGWVGQDERP